MKLLLALALTFGSFAAFAEIEDGPDMGKTFAERKAHMQTEIEQHLTAMNAHKTCVNAAADDAALKACRDKMIEMHAQKRMGNMEGRKDMLEKRMEKMKEKMEKKK